MNLVDKIKYAYFKGEPMPLKGHAKVILADGLTGKVQEVVESDNMVTNAVADILSKNWGGLAQYSQIFPLRNLYGGVMCFANEITENANNYNPPSEAVNPMKACAGDEAHSTADPYRGNPNGGETTTTDTSIKQVWDWNTFQGNGPISCVCLCPNTLGNMGLKPFSATYTPFSAFGINNLSYGNMTWDITEALKYPLHIAADGKTATVTYADGTTFTEKIVRHDYLAFGIMRSSLDWQVVSTRTATIRTNGNKRSIVEDNNYYYIISPTSTTALQIDKISKSDMTVTSADMSFSGITLYNDAVYDLPTRTCSLQVFPFDGRYLYYPDSTRTQFYKIDFTNQADPSLLNGTINISVGARVSDGREFANPLIISDGLIVGSTYIINGDTEYAIREFDLDFATAGYQNFVWLHRNGASMYGAGKQRASSSQYSRQGAVLGKMFLSTINNLESPITKSSSQTMKIEYTLTEA